jgi:hypothetical protein
MGCSLRRKVVQASDARFVALKFSAPLSPANDTCIFAAGAPRGGMHAGRGGLSKRPSE